MFNVKGSLVAIITPMHQDGSIDWKSLEELIEWHIQSGTDSIVAVGTTGESPTLNFEEHKAVIKFVVDKVNKRVPVIAGAGANSTEEAIELTVSAYQAGCDATLQVCPYYNKPPQRGLIAHFTAIAKAAPIPVVLYNVPGRTGCDINPQTTLELSKIPNICAIKEATDIKRLEEVRKLLPKESGFKIFSGEDGNCAEAVCKGFIDGVISVTANVAPAQMSQMMRLGLEGKTEEAMAINQKLEALHKNLFCEANPIPVKWAVNKLGKADKGIRLPLVELAEDKQELVVSALKQAGLI